MTSPLDTGLGFYRQVLALRGYRQEILSADIANASTPGFKAVDLDFAEAIKAASGADGARTWHVSDARHLAPDAAAGSVAGAGRWVKYQTGTEVTPDGNSVDLEHEKRAAAENAVDYQAATAFTSMKIKMLLTAINGAAAQTGNGA